MLSNNQINEAIDRLLRYRSKTSDGIRDIMSIPKPYTGPLPVPNIDNSVGLKISGDIYIVDNIKYIYLPISKISKKHTKILPEICISSGADVVLIDGYISKPYVSQSHIEGASHKYIISLPAIYPALMAMNNKMTFNYKRYTSYPSLDKLHINTLLSSDVLCTILGLRVGMYVEYDSIENISGSIVTVKRIRRVTNLSSIESTNEEIDENDIGEEIDEDDDVISDENFSDEAD